MDLGLEKIATREFGFLEREYGFKRVEAGPWYVRYETDSVFVGIAFDGTRSYEFGISLGRKEYPGGSVKDSFDLGEIIRSKGLSGKNIRTGFQITKSESLEKFARMLSDTLKQYAREFLTGSSEAFDRVAEFVVREGEAYALETNLRHMRNKLDPAWKSKNYKKVVELLTPFKAELKNSERKKLDYALKKERAT
jgi:hypothetical protein